jgi:hypothetical protein
LNSYGGYCAQERETGSCAVHLTSCAATTYCDDSYQCTPRKPDGSSCSWYDECQNASCYNGICQPAQVAYADTCMGAFY